MVTYVLAFLMSLVVSALSTVAVRNFGIRLGWFDQARSSRKVHATPVPRLGGVAIVVAFFAPLSALLVVDSGVGRTFLAHTDLIFALFLGGAAIAVLGIYDDLRGCGAPVKFSVQSAVAVALWWQGLRIETITSPFGGSIELGHLSVVFTVLWIVGIINALNLIDGLDGLAGGIAFVAATTNLILAFTRGDILLALCMAALAGAILGFLVFNFNPASIFMGDTGSMFLGFVLAVVSIKTSAKSGTAFAMIVPVLILGVPIMDTGLAMFRRAALGRSMFDADRDHIHHRLMSRLHLSHRDAVLVLYGLSVLFGATALGLASSSSIQGGLLLVASASVVVMVMVKLGYFDLKAAQKATVIRRRNLHLRLMTRRACREVERAFSLLEVWNALRPLGAELNAASWELWYHGLSTPSGEREGVRYQVERDAGTALPLDLVVELKERDLPPLGSLRASWRDGRSEVDRDEELALESIALVVTATVMRISIPPVPDGEAKVLPLRK